MRSLERELRSIRGVIACAIAGDGVSLLLAEDADVDVIREEATTIAATYGVSVRILAAPTTAAVPRRPATARSRYAAGALVAAAIGALIAVLPAGKKLAPRLVPPAAFGPSFAPEPAAPPNRVVRVPGHAVAPVRVAPAPRTASGFSCHDVVVRVRAAEPAGWAPSTTAVALPATGPASGGRAGEVGRGTQDRRRDGAHGHHDGSAGDHAGARPSGSGSRR